MKTPRRCNIEYVSPRPASKKGVHEAQRRTILEMLPAAGAPWTPRSRVNPPCNKRAPGVNFVEGVLERAWSTAPSDAGQTMELGGPMAGSSSASGGSSESSERGEAAAASSEPPPEADATEATAGMAGICALDAAASEGPDARLGCTEGFHFGPGGTRSPKPAVRTSPGKLAASSASSRPARDAGDCATICRLRRRSSRKTMLVARHLKQLEQSTMPHDRQW
mmetsp:Transcript_107940/g.311885  ORF Transcript_107940/g.311885 Transcript_107940/m.311885 type:complete len:222 (-) Transcript_107940:2938-3603(-)